MMIWLFYVIVTDFCGALDYRDSGVSGWTNWQEVRRHHLPQLVDPTRDLAVYLLHLHQYFLSEIMLLTMKITNNSVHN